jgi:Tfp pilus assembly protein PilN
MNPFEMVVIIVAIATLGSIFKAKYGLGGRKSRRTAEAASSENAQLRSEIAQLKDRIATLERLAIDRRQRLADEIDALADR